MNTLQPLQPCHSASDTPSSAVASVCAAPPAPSRPHPAQYSIFSTFGGLAVACLLAVATVLSGCDAQREKMLQEGVSTEADVRMQYGEPEKIWDGPDGGTVLEYNRQPAGHRNYMITLDRDGRLYRIEQVLTAENFARIEPGMSLEDVRAMLGKPAQVEKFPLKNETWYTWRYLDGTESMLFHTVFSNAMQVLRTETMADEKGNSSIYRNR